MSIERGPVSDVVAVGGGWRWLAVVSGVGRSGSAVEEQCRVTLAPPRAAGVARVSGV